MKKTGNPNNGTPFTIRVLLDRVIIVKPGILENSHSEEIVMIQEMPALGLEFITNQISVIEEKEKPKTTPVRQKKIGKTEKADKKVLIDEKAKFIGTTQPPGNGKIYEVYGKGKSYYLHRGKNRILIGPGISWVKYNRVLASLKERALPAELGIVKESLEAEKNLKLSGQDFNNWILIALVKTDIVVEIQNNEKTIKLKE